MLDGIVQGVQIKTKGTSPSEQNKIKKMRVIFDSLTIPREKTVKSLRNVKRLIE